MGDTIHYQDLTLEQIEQMLNDLQKEASSRRAKAWEKVKTAIQEYLEFESIDIAHHDETIRLDKSRSVDMETQGLIEIDLETW